MLSLRELQFPGEGFRDYFGFVFIFKKLLLEADLKKKWVGASQEDDREWKGIQEGKQK